jgi:hypothetical protein
LHDGRWFWRKFTLPAKKALDALKTSVVQIGGWYIFGVNPAFWAGELFIIKMQKSKTVFHGY